MNKISTFWKNIVVGFGGQLLILIFGLVLPRIIIEYFGSDANGLISTITQIFTYMALLEAGIGQAAKNELYKPLVNGDSDTVDIVYSTAQSYFRRITGIYAICVVLLSLLLPLCIKSDIDNITISLIVLLQGLSGVITFYFVQAPTVLLSADGRGYINNSINVFTKVLCYLAQICLAYCGLNLVLLQVAFFATNAFKVILYSLYIKKEYSHIKIVKGAQYKRFKDRNAYVITEVAWTIFSSTDMIVLSMFLSTKASSVYSVYNMVFAALNVLLNAVYMSIIYLLGRSFSESLDKYSKVHDLFNSVFIGGMSILMSITFVMIIPFVKLYTNEITDVNYINYTLPLMFCLIQILSWSRYVSGNLTGLAGYAKQTSYISLIEAILNISFSILLVRHFGIVGVTFATVIALPLKVIWCTYIADIKVMKRTCYKSIRIIIGNFLFFFLVVIASKYISLPIITYIDFIIWGIILTITIGFAGILVNVLLNRDTIELLRRYIVRR